MATTSILQNLPPPLLTLPLELRHEIYSYLFHPAHTHQSSATLHAKRKNPDTYIDTRIHLSARPPSNILHTCHQLREESLYYLAHLLDRRLLPPAPPRYQDFYDGLCSSEEPVLSEPALAKLSGITHSEVTELVTIKDPHEFAERARDEGEVRITLEVLRELRGDTGAYIPTRDQASPVFKALVPLLSRVKKVKFVVWGGWAWWYGPGDQEQRKWSEDNWYVAGRSEVMDSWERAAMRARTRDRSKRKEEVGIVVEEKKPDLLAVAVGTLLKDMPCVEEISVDVIIGDFEYYNLALPENRWEFIKVWLDGSVFPSDGRKLKKVRRRLIVSNIDPPVKVATFYHKLELWGECLGGEPSTVVQFVDGSAELSQTEDDQAFQELTSRKDTS